MLAFGSFEPFGDTYLYIPPLRCYVGRLGINMKTVTIVSDDRVGLLADVSYVLGKSNINIDALCVEVINGKAIIAMGVQNPKKTSSVLQGNGFKTTGENAIVIKVANKAVDDIRELLEQEKVMIKNFDSISSNATDAIYVLEVDKPRKASRMLGSFILSGLMPPSL